MTSGLSLAHIGNPFQQGFRAAQIGKFNNPYDRGSYDHANWFFGFSIWFDGIPPESFAQETFSQKQAKIYPFERKTHESSIRTQEA